jgi:hypothetical protein
MAQHAATNRSQKFPPARSGQTVHPSPLVFDTLGAVFDDGTKKLTVHDMFIMSAVTRCIVQSLLILPASNDEDTLLLLPSLFVGSAAQLRSLIQVVIDDVIVLELLFRRSLTFQTRLSC